MTPKKKGETATNTNQPKRAKSTAPARITAGQAIAIARNLFVNRTVTRALLCEGAAKPAYRIHFSDGSLVEVASDGGKIIRTEIAHDA